MTTLATPHIGRHRSAPARTARTARHSAQARTSGAVLTRLAGTLVGAVGTVVIALAAFALLAVSLGPRVLHYRTATMLTGSMAPTINAGDVIVDTQEPVRELRVGQIITYHIPVDDHRVESHRVTWVRTDKDGSVLFRTKGDANAADDPWTARSAAGTKVWIVRTELPVVGDVIRSLRQPVVQFALTRVLPVALVGFALFAIWRRKPDPSQVA